MANFIGRDMAVDLGTANTLVYVRGKGILLDEPSVMGVESLQVDQLSVRMVARTLPGKQFDVGRILRARAANALREDGHQLAAALDTAEPSGRS